MRLRTSLAAAVGRAPKNGTLLWIESVHSNVGVPRSAGAMKHSTQETAHADRTSWL